MREVHTLIDYAHPCILHTYGAIWPQKHECLYEVDDDGGSSDEEYSPMIVTERMTCDLLSGLSFPALKSIETRKSVALDIASALAHLHGRDVVHRDVKPENVLLRIVDGALVARAKLSDFGMSREVKTTWQMKSHATRGSAPGTIIYMPPEVLLDPWSCPSRRSWDFGALDCRFVFREDGKIYRDFRSMQ